MDQVIIGSNLKLLREESRLTLEELSEKTNIKIERLKELESGADSPYFSELELLLPILKISEEDLNSRDLVKERKDALQRMKKSSDRSSYNWYMGDKRTMVFYIIASLITIIVSALIITLGLNYISNINELINKTSNLDEIAVLKIEIRNALIFSAEAIGLVNFVFMLIEAIRKRMIHFKYWMLFFISLLPIIFIISFILTIPFIIYCIYRGIILHGKNR